MSPRNFLSLYSRLIALPLMLSFALAGSAWAHPEYRVTVVGPANSLATDINNAGVVVGTWSTAPNVTRAFLNRGRGLVDLGTLGGTVSTAAAINDRGEVVGNWRNAAGEWRGFIYACGRARDIGAIPGLLTGYTDINDAGYITASATLPDTNRTRGYLRAPDGKLTELGTLPVPGQAELATYTEALNNRNQVTGTSGRVTFPEQIFRAFGWRRGKIFDLGDLGSTPNAGRAINDRGQITGEAALPTFRAQAAFVYSNGRMINIDGRPDTGFPYSGGTGINNRGHVVGYSNHLSGFIWRGRRMESLNALIAPGSGWNISNPIAINDAGQIAANAERNGVQYAVRLDLLRPHVDAVPALEAPEQAEVAEVAGSARAQASPQAAALAQAEAEAQAREVVLPVGQ